MVGRSILQYQLIEKIGAGGMGEIYKAQDTRLNRFVAMKVLPPSMSADPERRRRFLQEAQAASALNHPNIITIYDIVSDGDTQYMVVEYVAGKTLLELIPRDGLRVPLVIQYATQMADALSAAHAAGIIHRDLKPANVMVTNSGLVKLLDFGLAKLVDRTPVQDMAATATSLRAPMTVEGTIMGTLNYMSPEQAEGKNVDARSDIFSMGTVLYEMLTGRSAFRGDSPISTLSAVLRDDVQPIVNLAPDVPLELEQIVVRCLKKDPSQRFQSAVEVQAALADLKRQSDSGALYNRAPASAIQPAPSPSPVARGSSRATGVAIASVLILIAAGSAGYWWMHQSQSQPGPAAVRAPEPAVASNKPSPVDAILTNGSVLEMVKEGVAPAVVISQIRSAKTNFDLSNAEVIRLSKAGVPAEVLLAMRAPQAGANAANPLTTSPPETPVPAAPAPAAIVLGDGVPVRLTLSEDVPVNAAEGSALQFKAASDVRVNDTVVIPKGAQANGFIVDAAKKKLLGLGGKMTFRLERIETPDGQKVNIRATPARSRDGSSKRRMDAGGNKSKELAAQAGTEYTAYIDGANTVSVRK